MAEQRWPFETPRDEMLARVVNRGRRIQMINRVAIGAGILGAAAVGVAGFVVGYSGGGDAGAAVTPSGVGYHACPDEGVVGELNAGDRVFLTGRDESGEWVQLRSPRSESSRVWIPAEAVDPDEAVDLPVAGCAPGPLEMALAEVPETTGPEDEVDEVEEPGVTTTTTTTPSQTTTTTATTTTTTTTTTPSQTTTTQAPTQTTTTTTQAPTQTTTTTTQAPLQPIISQLSRSSNQIWDSYNGLGQCSVSNPTQNLTTSVISVTTDHTTGATLSWTSSPVGISGSKPMSAGGGGTFSATLGPFPEGTVASAGGGQVTLNVSVVATGPGGSSPTSSTNVTLYECTLF